MRQIIRLLFSLLWVWSSLLALPVGADTIIAEDFAADPLQNGWRVFGDPALFAWNSTNQNLAVTWDSSQPNSGFYHALGTILTRQDDFRLAFDLTLAAIGPGIDPAKAATFEIAVGFLNVSQAAPSTFLRGNGTGSPNLVELDYFWDSGFGATVWPAVVSTNGTFNYNGSTDYAIFALTPGDGYHLSMTYAASNQTLVTTVTNVQGAAGRRLTQLVNTNFSDFRASAVSVTSYSDAGQAAPFAGSVLAQGTIDNIVVQVPSPPVQKLQSTYEKGVWNVQFDARPDWLYTLERTTDFTAWLSVGTAAGAAGALRLSDANPPAANAFYRVRADRP